MCRSTHLGTIVDSPAALGMVVANFLNRINFDYEPAESFILHEEIMPGTIRQLVLGFQWLREIPNSL